MTTEEIGARVMEKLKELDQVAYVRFASVYRRFEDLGDFVDELKTLLGRAPRTRESESESNARDGPSSSSATEASLPPDAPALDAAGRRRRGRAGLAPRLRDPGRRSRPDHGRRRRAAS